MVVEVLARPELFKELFDGLTRETLLTWMHTPYAISRVAVKRPDLRQPYKERFSDRLATRPGGHLVGLLLIAVSLRSSLNPSLKQIFLPGCQAAEGVAYPSGCPV